MKNAKITQTYSTTQNTTTTTVTTTIGENVMTESFTVDSCETLLGFQVRTLIEDCVIPANIGSKMTATALKRIYKIPSVGGYSEAVRWILALTEAAKTPATKAKEAAKLAQLEADRIAAIPTSSQTRFGFDCAALFIPDNLDDYGFEKALELYNWIKDNNNTQYDGIAAMLNEYFKFTPAVEIDVEIAVVVDVEIDRSPLTIEEQAAQAAVKEFYQSNELNRQILISVLKSDPLSEVGFCKQIGTTKGTAAARVRHLLAAAKVPKGQTELNHLKRLTGYRISTQGGWKKTI
jgi:hypothetical protein